MQASFFCKVPCATVFNIELKFYFLWVHISYISFFTGASI